MSHNYILQKIQVTGATANGNITLPANAFLKDVIIQNTTGNAITGGIALGTTAAGVDVYAALAVGANALVFAVAASFLKRYFSTSATQNIYYSAVTLWNSANVNITFIYYQL
jgi:hypothetical protein